MEGGREGGSNNFLEDCKVGTSPEKMYYVDGFRKSVIMSNVRGCSEEHVCTLQGTQNKAFHHFSNLVQFDCFSTLYKLLSVWAETLKA